MSEVDYPADSLQGGKRTIKWIRSLPKSEIHKVIIDKNLPESIMEDLCRELPFQYLQNFACNRKVPSRVRVMILRRAFRAQESDFKNDKKMQLFSVILGLSFVSKKEKQVAKSYIQEIQGPNTHGKRKRTKETRSNSEVKTPNRVQAYFSSFQTKDSTKEEIFAVLIDLAFASQSAEYKFDRQLLQERVNVFWPIYMKESGNKSILIDPRLIVLQIQLSSGTLPIQSKLRIETLQETLRNKVRGSHRDELIANCLDQGNVNQTLHEMLIWTYGDDNNSRLRLKDYLSRFCGEFSRLRNEIPETISLFKIENVSDRKAKVEIETDSIVDMRNSNIIYWKSGTESEQDGFSEDFAQSYCPFNNKRRYVATLSNLSKDCEYSFRISIPNSSSEFVQLLHSFVAKRDEPVQIYEPWSGYSGGYSIQDYIVPPGGGGERRRQQF
jgi:hypothetical protein